jgi:polar amino acid transport system permease protein
VARTKRPTWPWHGLTALIILVIGVGIWYSTSLISYEWRWNRVPQYFAYQAEEAQRAESLSRVAKIEQNGREARVTLVAEDGRQQELKVAGDSLQFSENDDVSEGDVVGVQRHWTAGPLAWGLWTTLWISFVSGALGLAIGLFTGLCRLSKNPTLHDLSTLYVELVRGTPLLVQIFIFYFFIGTVLNLSREFAGVAALALFTGAYVAEIVRSGVQSIARGQDEAARSLGLNAGQSMRYVILPQAFKRVLPPLAGQFISLVKDTSLVSVIAITDLMRQTSIAVGVTKQPFFFYLVACLIYLAFSILSSAVFARAEARASRGLKRVGGKA